MRAVKLHGHEAMRENGWRNRYAEVISATYRTRIFGIQLDLAESLLFGLQFLLVVYIGALAVLSQQLTIGLLLAFIAYRTNFTGSATALVDQLQSWRLLGLHLERLSDIVAEKREEMTVAPRRGLLPAPAIRAEGLSFAYGPAEAPIFDNLDFEIPAGGFVAITGKSGTGKTTLMRVMLGLLPASGGRLLIDNVPIGPATIASWRGRIGVVMQDDHLLTGTLADNIAFFDPRLDLDRVEQAARLARVHEDIVRMPMAYQSLIGDMGAALSAGQRQRIILARALYRDPDALFLDEGTANLDEENENAIGDMIASLPITRVVIAHRPALVERADLVLHLEDGAFRVVRDRRRAYAR
jgi:ATP-binding cassette subfamily B protein RaxB